MFQTSLTKKLVKTIFAVGLGLTVAACEKKEEAAAPAPEAPPAEAAPAESAPPAEAPATDAAPPASN